MLRDDENNLEYFFEPCKSVFPALRRPCNVSFHVTKEADKPITFKLAPCALNHARFVASSFKSGHRPADRLPLQVQRVPKQFRCTRRGSVLKLLQSSRCSLPALRSWTRSGSVSTCDMYETNLMSQYWEKDISKRKTPVVAVVLHWPQRRRINETPTTLSRPVLHCTF